MLMKKSYSQLLQQKETQTKAMLISGWMLVLFFTASAVSWGNSLLLFFTFISLIWILASIYVISPYPEIDNVEQAMISKFWRKTLNSMIENFSNRELDLVADDVMRNERLNLIEEEKEIQENLKNVRESYKL